METPDRHTRKAAPHMTLIADLIDIPEQVHKSDFVISLKSAIQDPDRTLADYVVTPQLADCFDEALSLVASAVEGRTSKSTYLHASFGAGKSAFMAVTNLLLSEHPSARAKPELAPVVAKYQSRLTGKRFLLVPYQAVGANSIEQIVLGGYVEHVRRLHPDAAVPPVYVADGIFADAHLKRADLGDETFFRLLSDGDQSDEWGDYGAGWDAERFEAALAAAAGSSEKDQLLSALLRTHYRAVPGQANATADGFVPLDDGLEAVSRHAKALGYDAVVLFLDELVLWLASRSGDIDFLNREGAKIVKLVEGDDEARPAPIIGFIARQRDLKELVGDHVPGVQAASATHVLRFSEGRFGTITLADNNLAAIAEQRLLRPVDAQARQILDDTFERLRRQLDERGERDVLLTDTGDLDAFRRLYPFSPALVDALVALSGAMQRERTALKVMLQLLVESRDRLEVGQLIPLGDLYDVIDAGDEPLTEVMRSQFQQARRLWTQKFEPMLLRNHQLTAEAADHVPVGHAYVTDARLAKSLLIAALVPEVAPLRNLTVSRLTALNSGIVRTFVPGTERQQVLEKLRSWSSEIGEIRLDGDEQDPTVRVALTGIDTGPILDAAKTVDNDGERRRRVKELLAEALQLRDADSFEPWIEVLWRGTPRRVDVVFGNVRDASVLADDMLRAGAHPKLVIDHPWDSADYGPADDRARIDQYREQRAAEWTGIWLPNFLTGQSEQLLGRLVRLDWVLTGDNFDRLAGHLSPTDRPLARAQLTNELSAVRERVQAVLRQAYGVDPGQAGHVDGQLQPADQYHTLDPAITLRPPAGTSLRTFAENLAGQLYAARYPKHPEFTERITTADLRHTLTHVLRALDQPNQRLENVEATMRKVLTKVVGPLQLGTMHSAHFIADVQPWVDLAERRRSEAGVTAPTVRMMRTWLDGADTPEDRRGLTTEVADLVILSVAAATNRSLAEGSRNVATPDIGKLRDEWELRAHDLPDDETWRTALARAQDLGIVPVSALRSATAVAQLEQQLQEFVAAVADDVRHLPAALGVLTDVVELPEDAARLATARAAAVFVDQLAQRPGHAASVLAALEVPTTVAAIGTSIAQARPSVAALRSLNVELVGQAVTLSGAFAARAARIRERLAEAALADELTIPLASRLQEAEEAATSLVGEAARAHMAATPAPAGPVTGADPTSDPASASASTAGASVDPSAPSSTSVGVVSAGVPTAPAPTRQAIEAHLDALGAQAAALGLELIWELREQDADGSS